MATRFTDWIRNHRTTVMGWIAGLLLLVIVVEGFLLFEQRTAIQASEAQSSKLLNKFLEGDTAEVSGASGVAVRLENVRFKWSEKVYIDAGNMAMRAVPLHGRVVEFDDLESFRLKLQRSSVSIRPEVLEGMFNESVFNYPHSKLRDLKVTLKEDDGQRAVGVKGSVNVGLWLPFEMSARLLVDKATNTLVIDVDDIKVLGLPATALMKWKPLRMESILTLPPNNSLVVDKNRMMVRPFGLFPPPRVDGTMESVTVGDKDIQLTFAGDPIPAPHAAAKNYVYLKGGISQFGNIRMLDTDILILDKDQSNAFAFSLSRYAAMVPRSQIEVHDTKSARIVMPDF